MRNPDFFSKRTQPFHKVHFHSFDLFQGRKMQAREEITTSATGADGNHATVVCPPRAATGTLETFSFFQARYI